MSLVWVMVVGAAHDADDIGTVATDKPVVSPDEVNVAAGDRTVSIRVDFSETIDGLSVNPNGSEFTVAGFTVTGAQHFAGAKNSVFLTVTPDLNPDSAPVVSLTGEVTDLAGDPAATGDETSKDGIAPTPIATTSVDLSTGAVSITVTSGSS